MGKTGKIILLVLVLVLVIVLVIRGRQSVPLKDQSGESTMEKALSFLNNLSKPRGIRNNNPGNIRINKAVAWKGRIPLEQNQDGTFEQFENLAFGVRAMVRNLRNYITKYNADTLRTIVNRWAPNNENDSTKYLQDLVAWTGWDPDQKISFTPEEFYPLVKAISRKENSLDVIDQKVFNQAWSIENA